MSAPSGRPTALAVVVFGLLSIVWWWPLPWQWATTAIAPPFGDPLLNAWTLAWDADRLAHGLADYWDGLFFYPYRDTVAYSEHLLGIAIFTAPLQGLTGNPMLVLNVATVASTALTGVGTFVLARGLTGRTDAALVAGVAMACAPYRLGHAWHLQVLMSGWMPLAWHGLHRFLSTRSVRPLVGFTAAFVLQGLSNGYFLYYTAIGAAVIALHGAWRHRRHARLVLVGLTASATAILVLLAPVAIAYVRVRREQGFSRTLTDVAAYGASLDAFAHVAPSAWFWGRWLPVGRDELQLFPGLTLPLLALLAVASLRWRRARDRADAAGAPALLPDQAGHVRLYTAIAALTLLLAFGPAATILGMPLPGGGPYAWLAGLLPGFDGLRVPARLMTPALLACAVLSALGIAALTARWSTRTRRAAVALAVVGLAVEGHGGGVALTPFPTADMHAEADAYAWLAAQPRGPLLALPAGDAALETRHLYRTLTHRHPVVNGYSGYGSILQELVAGPPFTEVARLDGALAMARALGLRWITIAPELYEYPAAGAVVAQAIAASDAHVARALTKGPVTIVELKPPVERPPAPDPSWLPVADATVRASHASGDVGRLTDGADEPRWSTGVRQSGVEWIEVALPTLTDVARLRLELSRRSLGDYPRGLVVEAARPDGSWATLFDGDVLASLGRTLVATPRSPAVDVRLPSMPTRTLRLRVTGQTRVWFWSIHELRLWARAPAPPG